MKWHKDGIRVYTLVAVLIVVSVTALAIADDIVWTGSAGDSDWFNALNWGGGAVPAPDDTVRIDAATVVAAMPVTVADGGRLCVSNSVATLGELTVARTRYGDFDADLTDGSLVTEMTTISELNNFASSFGVMSVFSDTTDERIWVNERLVTIGASGSACLVTDGVDTLAAAVSAGLFHDGWGQWEVVSGDATVHGDISAGVYGEGNIYVYEGASITGESGMLGLAEGVAGGLHVEPGGAAAIDDVLVVGYSGLGTLDVGGAVDCQTAVVGGKLESQAGGQGEVTVKGTGVWTCRGDVYVGEGGHGAVLVEQAGQVSTGDCYVGYPPAAEQGDALVSSSVGEVTIAPVATWTCAGMHVGGAGAGYLKVQGNLQVRGQLTIAAQGQSEGYLGCFGDIQATDVLLGREQAGSEPQEIDSLWNANGGRIYFRGGSILVTGEFRIRQSGRIADGLSGIVTLDGASLINESTDPAKLVGLEKITINAESSSGDPVTIEAAGADEGPDIETLDGRFYMWELGIGNETNVTVRLVDEFDNTLSESESEAVYVRELYVASGSTLDLNGLNLYCLDRPRVFGEVINGTVTRIRVAGDVNYDGRVDLKDFVLFKNNYGGDASRQAGDLTEDGYIDFDDFRILKANFGREADWAN